jgi:ABC-type multidrug transport system fused ATPase/permease subunit
VHPITATHDWIVAHPVAMMFILFALSGLLSLFAQEIKRFLSTWPGRTLNSATRKNLTNRLNTLENLNQNPYMLLIYFGLMFTDTIMDILTWSFILIGGYLAIFHTLVPRGLIISTAGGIFASKVYTFGAVLKDLCKFNTVSAELRTSIEQVDQWIAKEKEAKETEGV